MAARAVSALEQPLIVITGPTASGKSSLALDLAEKFGGEIICADSRTVYKGMDIGTAKPTSTDQARVPHHLLDIVAPDQRFSAADFQRLAFAAIAEIRSRGKVPFLVGGTGLYIDSVVLDYTFGDRREAGSYTDLEQMSVEQLVTMIERQRIDLPSDPKNKRRLIRAIETSGTRGGAQKEPSANTHVVAITTSKEELARRIASRAHDMFEAGVLAEAAHLGKTYGWDCEAMTGNIYPLLHRVLVGELSEQQAIEESIRRDTQLVKRQLTWIKRHDYVHWLSIEQARVFIEGLLTNQDEIVLV